MVVEVLAEASDYLKLFVNSQPIDSDLDHIANGGLVYSYEAVVVHESEETHDELAVHAVSDTAMAWDRLAKVLDFECAFQARGKKATERSDE